MMGLQSLQILTGTHLKDSVTCAYPDVKPCQILQRIQSPVSVCLLSLSLSLTVSLSLSLSVCVSVYTTISIGRAQLKIPRSRVQIPPLAPEGRKRCSIDTVMCQSLTLIVIQEQPWIRIKNVYAAMWRRHCDTQHKDTQHNDTQHSDTAKITIILTIFSIIVNKMQHPA
jgi:hypothetical protein